MDLVNPETFEVDGGGTLDVPGVISGEGGLTKFGAGVLQFDSSNTYTGGTAINNGIVNVTTSAALGTGAVAVNSNSGAVTRGELDIEGTTSRSPMP